MSSDWRKIELSELAIINPKRVIPRGAEAPFIDMAALPTDSRDIDNTPRQRIFKGGGSRFMNGDTLLARITPCLENGKTAFVNNLKDNTIGHGSTEFIVLSSKDPEDRKFIYYLVRGEAFRSYAIARMEGTSGRQRVPTDAVAKYTFSCPPKSIRSEISNFLCLFDDRITLLRETNKTLEAIAQAIYKSWFVDFDPVHAKAEGRAPEGMDEETAALFPDEFEKSELGLVPEGWELVPFGELLTKTIGGDWGSEHPTSTNKVEIAIIRGTDIPDLSYGGRNRVPVRYTTEKKMRSRKLQAGDIVIEISGGSKKQPTGRSILISNELLSRFNSHVVPASFCRLFRPTNIPIGVMLAEHLKLLYEQGLTWNYQNQSTGIANFQTEHFLKSELVIKPPKQLIHAFFEIVYPLVNKTQTQKILTLEKLRDTLLPHLISGKLRLPEAESLVEEVI